MRFLLPKTSHVRTTPLTQNEPGRILLWVNFTYANFTSPSKSHVPYVTESIKWKGYVPCQKWLVLGWIDQHAKQYTCIRSFFFFFFSVFLFFLQKQISVKSPFHISFGWIQDTRHLKQRPCYQRGSPCQGSAGNRTTRRPEHRKETQTSVVWSCLPLIRSGQNHLARHSERGKKTGQTEEVRRQHQGMDRPGVRQVPENIGEQRKKWSRLVVKSPVVHQRPSRLWDRWWWWWS